MPPPRPFHQMFKVHFQVQNSMTNKTSVSNHVLLTISVAKEDHVLKKYMYVYALSVGTDCVLYAYIGTYI